MSTNRSEAYLRTRISILAGQLYSEQDIEDLLQDPLDTVSTHHGLSSVFDGGLSVHAGNRAIERALIQRLMTDHSILLRPLKGSSREVLIYWLRKFELFNLKALIRGKLHNLDAEAIQQQLHELPPLISLPHDKLARTENIQELLRQLDQGPYSDIARQARQVYEERNEPFSLDATIDQRYYAGLLSRAQATDPEDRGPLLELLGTLVDHQNLLWLLRYRFAYRLTASETYYLLLSRGRLLGRERLLHLVEVSRYDEVINALPPELGELLQKTENPSQAESVLDARMVRESRKALRTSPSAITRALAYLILRDLDLRRLLAIIQGKVLQLSDEIIRTAAGATAPVDEAHMQ
jgi:V/A-type H+-transporting ATPase subunit C